VIASVMVMMWAAGPIGDFVERHPAVKILALAFLILIGVMLIAEGLGQHMNKGYIYFAMAFALGVELLQIRMHAKATKS
jgi:predicted tellurium resistance membrane protein TerC